MTSPSHLPPDPSPPAEPNTYYHQQTHHRSLIGHISLSITSYPTSQKFYTSVLSALSVSLIYSSPERKILGYGFSNPDREILTLFEQPETETETVRVPGAGTHIAFNARDREAVKRFWEEGVRNGGKDNGAPGLRERYGRGYFAAYLLDPDGWRLEAVVHEDVEEGEQG